MNRHKQRMNKVLQFIEETLDKEVSISCLAQMAFYSEFHFHRLFRSYVGESVYAYRKRLLLERSIKYLQHSEKTITEIALDSGYNNHSSFNKAFKKYFNHSPSEVRQNMVAFNKYKLPQIEEDMNIEPKIIELEDVAVIAARGVGNFEQVAALAWGKIMQYAYSNGYMNDKVQRFGITYDDPNVTDLDKIRYDACLSIDADISQ